MTITPQQLLDQAVPRSAKNRQAIVSAAGTEYLSLINRVLQTFFSVAARINPGFYGVKTSLTWNGAALGWARPAGAEAVFLLERSNGDEISIVPYAERNMDSSVRVYALGQFYRQITGALPAANEALTALYTQQAPVVSALTANITALWPENFNGLLVEELAIYLALKDGRVDEVGELRRSRDSWLRLYLAHLEHETLGVSRRFAPDYFLANSIVPLNTLLAAGTEVDV